VRAFVSVVRGQASARGRSPRRSVLLLLLLLLLRRRRAVANECKRCRAWATTSDLVLTPFPYPVTSLRAATTAPRPPAVYELDADLKPVRHYYLGDQAAIAAKIHAVAKQGTAQKA
jgi:hypothetical protein